MLRTKNALLALIAAVCLGSFTADAATVNPNVALVSATPAPVQSGFPESFNYRRQACTDDGRYVVFVSNAFNLLDPSQLATLTGFQQVYVRDVKLGITALVSVNTNNNTASGNGDSDLPSITMSPDGTRLYIAFVSQAANLAPTNVTTTLNHGNVFIRTILLSDLDSVSPANRNHGVTKLVSVNNNVVPPTEGNGKSQGIIFSTTFGDLPPIIKVSPDGLNVYVCFISAASDLTITGTGVTDTNGVDDVFIRSFDASKLVSTLSGDIAPGVTNLVSRNANNTDAGDGISDYPSMVVTNSTVYCAFESVASTISSASVAVHNGLSDIFVRRMLRTDVDLGNSVGVTNLVSIEDGVSSEADASCLKPDLAVSPASDEIYVCWESTAQGLVLPTKVQDKQNMIAFPNGNGTQNDVFVRIMSDVSLQTVTNAGFTSVVSLSKIGSPLRTSNGTSTTSRIAALPDGSGVYVAFVSNSSDLIATFAPTSGFPNIYIREMLNPALLAQNHVGVTTLVSAAITILSGGQGDGVCDLPCIGIRTNPATPTTIDFVYVAFASTSRNLTPVPDFNGGGDTFVRQFLPTELHSGAATTTGLTILCSFNDTNTAAGNQGENTPEPYVAPNGHVIFTASAGDLVPNDFNGVEDVFISDRPVTVAHTIANQTTPEDVQLTPFIDLWNTFDDFDDLDSQLTYTFSSSTTLVPNLPVTTVTSGSSVTDVAGFSVNTNTGKLGIRGAADRSGVTKITITATDSYGKTASTSFFLTITAVNDAPQFTGGPNVKGQPGIPKTIANWATFIRPGPPTATDEVAQTVHFNVVSNDNPTLFASLPSISTSGALSFTLIPGASGTATVGITLQDNGGTANGGVDTSSPPYTFTISANNAPTAIPQGFFVAPGGTYTAPPGPLAGSDPDSDPLTFAIVKAPAQGTVVLQAPVTSTTQGFKFTANGGASGTDSFTFKVNDGTVDSVPAIVNITYGTTGNPVAVITPQGPTTGYAPLTTQFSGEGSYTIQGPSVNAWVWTSGGGPAILPLAAPGPVTFNTPGVYTVTLTVSDTQPATSTPASITVTVLDPAAGVPGGGQDMRINNASYSINWALHASSNQVDPFQATGRINLAALEAAGLNSYNLSGTTAQFTIAGAGSDSISAVTTNANPLVVTWTDAETTITTPLGRLSLNPLTGDFTVQVSQLDMATITGASNAVHVNTAENLTLTLVIGTSPSYTAVAKIRTVLNQVAVGRSATGSYAYGNALTPPTTDHFQITSMSLVTSQAANGTFLQKVTFTADLFQGPPQTYDPTAGAATTTVTIGSYSIGVPAAQFRKITGPQFIGTDPTGFKITFNQRLWTVTGETPFVTYDPTTGSPFGIPPVLNASSDPRFEAFLPLTIQISGGSNSLPSQSTTTRLVRRGTQFSTP